MREVGGDYWETGSLENSYYCGKKGGIGGSRGKVESLNCGRKRPKDL